LSGRYVGSCLCDTTTETMKRYKDIGIAIVGSGMISEIHADAIRKVPGARVVGFCSRTRAAAEARAAQFGGVACTRVEELVANPDVDAVSICTPSGVHMEPAIIAANAKKHVMVEKPIEITLERTDAIIDACKRNGVKLGGIFPRRFLASSQLLKEAIAAQRFGAISLADVYIKWYRTQQYYAEGGWRGTQQYDGGGALMNQGIHGVDLLQWLMGGVETVTAFTATRAHTGIEVEDVAVASLRFRSGALGVIEASTGSWPGDRLRVEISGSDGSAVLEDSTIRTWMFRQTAPEDESVRARFAPREGLSSGGAIDPRAMDGEGHRQQFEDFVAAIREERAPRIDGAEARSAVAIVTAIYLSAREGRTVRVAAG
jgi:UDP-N-acetyl-2-amino-2-deoxyglucuronate dehydrogenase